MSLAEPLNELVRNPKTLTAGKGFPSRIHIYDETLRDGEQMPGVAFSPAQKVEMAGFLSDIGVSVLMAAYPGVAPSEQQSYAQILTAQRAGRISQDVEVMTIARADRVDIDASARCTRDAGADLGRVGILILSTSSDLHLKYKLGRSLLRYKGRATEEWLTTPLEWYRQANIDLLTDHINYARELGFGTVEFAAEDASRGDRDYLIRWAQACREAGGTRLCFSDTCGVLTPEAVDYYFSGLADALPGLAITAHFHNDFGLAAINTVRALSYGATHASICAAGIGERAGNGSIHQVVMVLKELYGVEIPGFAYERLWELRNLIERYSGIVIQAHEPIIGRNVFSHESGIHTAAIAIHPAIYQFLDERVVGGDHRFVYGKHSGKASVLYLLEKRRKDLPFAPEAVTDVVVEKTLARIKQERDRRILEPGFPEFVRTYYEHLDRLGIQEEMVIEILKEEIELSPGHKAIGH